MGGQERKFVIVSSIITGQYPNCDFQSDQLLYLLPLILSFIVGPIVFVLLDLV